MRSVLDYLEKSAERYPNKTAFSDAHDSITFRELRDRARALGAVIAKTVNSSEKPVAVFIDRAVGTVVRFMAVLYSGNFYVPLDLSQPEARLNSMLASLEPAAVLAPNWLRQRTETLTGAPVIDESITAPPVSEPPEVNDNTPLYAMFTSGSTGTPKCALITHRGMTALAESFSEAFGLGESVVLGNQAPFDFDVSAKDIYMGLRNAATVHIIPKELFSAPKSLPGFLNERRVNTLIWAVSALRIVSSLNVFKRESPRFLDTVMFSGEVMPVRTLNYWRQYLPNARFVNLYGPTEITCNCAYHIIDREYTPGEAIPIGRPFAHSRVYLKSGGADVTEPGVTGEIYVGGDGVGLGYYRNPQRTAESFFEDGGSPVYKTGDLGEYGEDGLLYFKGRADTQIKHMGFRIELGEIELAAGAVEFVRACAALYDTRREKITLFYESDEKRDMELARELLKLLPKQMLPGRMVWMAELPRNKNGKLDRAELRAAYIGRED